MGELWSLGADSSPRQPRQPAGWEDIALFQSLVVSSRLVYSIRKSQIGNLVFLKIAPSCLIFQCPHFLSLFYSCRTKPSVILTTWCLPSELRLILG